MLKKARMCDLFYVIKVIRLGGCEEGAVQS